MKLPKMSPQTNPKNVFITGGSGFIGRQIIEKLKAKNYKIFSLSRENLTSQTDAHFFQGDLSKSKSLLEIAKYFSNKNIKLDALIHCAGHSPDNNILKTSSQNFQKAMEINFTKILELCLLLKPHLNHPAHILNIGSRVSFQGNFGQSSYACSKGSLWDLTQYLAQEWGPDKICVNLVIPGVHPSKMLGENKAQIIKIAKQESLLNSLSSMEDLTNMILFLLNTNTITGQIFAAESRPLRQN